MRRIIWALCVWGIVVALPYGSEAATTHEEKCQNGVLSSVSSIACTLTTVTAGNSITVLVYWNTGSGVTLDSVTIGAPCTGSFTLYNNGQAAGNTKGATGALLNVGTGGSCVVTATFSASVSETKFWAHEVSCDTNPCTVAGNDADTDIFRSATCTDCIPDAAGQLAITPSQNNAYFFGGCITSSGSAVFDPGTDFTLGATNTSRGIAEYYIQTTAASHATTCSRADANGTTAVAFALVLQPTAAGGGSGSKIMLLGVGGA